MFQVSRGTLVKIALVTLMIFSYSACSEPSGNHSATPVEGAQELTVSGETLFHAKTCYTCHTIGKGPLVGPDLKGLFQRRSEEWVRKFISDPVQMTQTDPVARELKGKYFSQMPKLNLSPAEIDALVNYLKTATQ